MHEHAGLLTFCPVHYKVDKKYSEEIMFEGLFQPMHLLLILVIVLVIFGPGKLPELGSALGKAIRGFKQSMNEPEKKIENSPDPDKTEKK